MSFKRFVETGRVAFISKGPNKGKLCAIVGVIDQTRVLVDGPLTGVDRQGIRLKQIQLTKYCVKFPHEAGSGTVRKAWMKGKIEEQWKKSQWACNLAKKKKRFAMTDFDRFKLRRTVQKRNRIVSKAFCFLKKQALRNNALYGMKKVPISAERSAALSRLYRKRKILREQLKARRTARNKLKREKYFARTGRVFKNQSTRKKSRALTESGTELAPTKPTSGKPTTKPATGKPSATKPATGKPSATKPVTGKPSATKPVTGKPSATKPATGKPSATKPVTGKPSATKPATAKPSATKPAAAKPAAAKPAAAKPAAAKPAAAKPAAAKPAASKEAPKK